jgi:hypothetical protein
VMDAVVSLIWNVSRSGHRFVVDVECQFFVDTFDLCVQKTQSLIVFNFMCQFDLIVTSVHSHEHPVDCVLPHNAEYTVKVSNPHFTVAFPSQP